jgi:hypothetical protein
LKFVVFYEKCLSKFLPHFFPLTEKVGHPCFRLSDLKPTFSIVFGCVSIAGKEASRFGKNFLRPERR